MTEGRPAIWWSTHIERAFLTRGSSSSRFFGLRGLEFHVMFVVSAPGTSLTTMFGSFFSTSTVLNGTWSTQSRFPFCRSSTMESEFV